MARFTKEKLKAEVVAKKPTEKEVLSIFSEMEDFQKKENAAYQKFKRSVKALTPSDLVKLHHMLTFTKRPSEKNLRRFSRLGLPIALFETTSKTAITKVINRSRKDIWPVFVAKNTTKISARNRVEEYLMELNIKYLPGLLKTEEYMLALYACHLEAIEKARLKVEKDSRSGETD